MKIPRILIFSGFGLNCEEETKFAFEKAGGKADIVHINDLISGDHTLDSYQIIAFPGGFSYGDDTGSGNAFANRVKNHLWEKLHSFLKRDTLVIGICNGFQIITNLGLLPVIEVEYGHRETTLLHNSTARYMDRWVDVKVSNSSPWLKNIKTMMLPIAHGEGRFYAKPDILKALKQKKMLALQYYEGEICQWQSMEANPNGALEDIAGITSENGKIFGLMPHPERAISFTHLPHWTYLKEKYKREGSKIPHEGPGIQIFKNAIHYFGN